jgi:hypothetical protein
MERFAQLDDSELGSRKAHNLVLILNEAWRAGITNRVLVPARQATVAGGIDTWAP